jgi:hypothetical protein
MSPKRLETAGWNDLMEKQRRISHIVTDITLQHLEDLQRFRLGRPGSCPPWLLALLGALAGTLFSGSAAP